VEGRGFAGGPQFVDDFDIGDIFDSFFGGAICYSKPFLPPSLPPSFPPSFPSFFSLWTIFTLAISLIPFLEVRCSLPPSLPPFLLSCVRVCVC